LNISPEPVPGTSRGLSIPDFAENSRSDLGIENGLIPTLAVGLPFSTGWNVFETGSRNRNSWWLRNGAGLIYAD
jgi:hypothetical protein